MHTIEAWAGEEGPAILVTAFNKGVIDLLADWIESLMRGREGFSNVQRPIPLTGPVPMTGRHELTARCNGRSVQVSLWNRDKLPTSLFELPKSGRLPDWKPEVAQRKARVTGMSAAVERRLTADFLQDELERSTQGAS